MDNPSVLDVRVRFLRWIIGRLAGVSLAGVVMLAAYVYVTEFEAAMFVLIAVLVIGLTAFVYKTEVDRQEEEIRRDQATKPPTAIVNAEQSRNRV
jgi:hypothetical protein